MMADNGQRESLLRTLISTLETSLELGEADSQFVHAFLRLGSDTYDNRQCVERLGVVKLRDSLGIGQKGLGLGLGLRTSGVAVASILNYAEGSPIPAAVVEGFPKVTQEDWDATLRLATMVFIALERPSRYGRQLDK